MIDAPPAHHHPHPHKHHHHRLTPRQRKALKHRRLRRRVLRWAKKQLGKPYVFGAAGPHAFDCSGLVSYVYLKAGLGFGRLTAYLLSRVGKPVYGRLHPGDILVVNGGEHVVLYVGDGAVIAAPHTGDHVRYQPVSRFLRNLYAARRVIPWDTVR